MPKMSSLRQRSLARVEPPGAEPRPSDGEAEAAFRWILLWMGENPDRDGLRETPKRLIKAYREYLCGYDEEPEQILRKTFEETEGYDGGTVVLRGETFESHWEHHMAPIIGRAWVGYLPGRRVVGISKLARVVDYARRMQIQVRMTAIANAIERKLKPRGVAVDQGGTSLHAVTRRGVRERSSDLVTSRTLGCFRDDRMTRSEFLAMPNGG